ncbi:hypothetical protein QUF76_07665 [Desulfobacterales bacterium HSG16]|nr:hypothetical protein [Desulfobacterales bacterium HSG16]
MIENCLDRKLVWSETDNADVPYSACVDNENWIIRLNDFPEEPLYTLLIEDRPVIDFDDWPKSWQRP